MDGRQHGSYKREYIATALLEAVHNFASAIDAVSNRCHFLDFLKAFDFVKTAAKS